MGVMTYAYRLHPVTGLPQHIACDRDELPRLAGEGWHDAPDKVPGSPAAQARLERIAAETAHTTGREPAASGPVHGEEPKRRRA